MKHFTHIESKILEKLTADLTDIGRIYTSPTGMQYPSVTTVISEFNKKAIEEWKERVGEEKAKRIGFQAATRGTIIHSISEEYLYNNPDYLLGRMPNHIFTFKQIQPILDQCIDNIHYLEASLYSNYLKVAGTVDCVAEYKGKLSVIDFKTSRKPKKKEWIKNYFMQESAYAVMYEERTGIPITQLVTIISVDDSEPQVFIEKRDSHISDFIKERKAFKEKYNV